MARRERTPQEIPVLFSLAEKATDPLLARRYVTLARKLAAKRRISLRAYNRVHCRKCNTYWSSETLQVRTRSQSVVYTCLHCGTIKRIRK